MTCEAHRTLMKITRGTGERARRAYPSTGMKQASEGGVRRQPRQRVTSEIRDPRGTSEGTMNVVDGFNLFGGVRLTS